MQEESYAVGWESKNFEDIMIFARGKLGTSGLSVSNGF